jgi:hypothetical protein
MMRKSYKRFLLSSDMELTLPSPEVIAQADPIDNKVHAHNAWVVCCSLSIFLAH